MCGRFASFRLADDLADIFAVDEVTDDALLLPASWNVAPTQPVRIVVEREHDDVIRRSIQVARWGLVPGWAKNPSIGSRMINARVESLADKPAFRTAAAARRCLVPAEGYYEWQTTSPSPCDHTCGVALSPSDRSPGTAPSPSRRSRNAPKQPYWIHATDGGPLALAGLYEFWRDPDRDDDDPMRWLVTTTVITGPAPQDDPVLSAIHGRMPAILDPSQWATWLDPRMRDAHAAIALLDHPALPLVATAISPTVNHVGTDGPELITPADQSAQSPSVN